MQKRCINIYNINSFFASYSYKNDVCLKERRQRTWEEGGIKMEERQGVSNHKVSFVGRSNGIITGVKDVLSFDANEIILDTEMGMLMMKGMELHVTSLTVEKGEVKIDGRIDSLIYSEMHNGKKQAEGILARLFK